MSSAPALSASCARPLIRYCLVLVPQTREHRWPTIGELVARNRRVLFEQQSSEFAAINASASLFFTPAVWDGDQFGPDSFQNFPACTVSGAVSHPDCPDCPGRVLGAIARG